MKLSTFKIWLNKYSLTLLWLLLVGIFLIRACTFNSSGIDQDEIEALHTAWKIYEGLTIYKDFFQHHHPLLYYILTPLITFFGTTLTTVFIARLLMIFNYFACGLVTYELMGTIIQSPLTQLLATYLLLFSAGFSKLLEIRPDSLQTSCGLLACFLLFTFLKKRNFLLLLASGFFLALSFLFLQKAIFLGALYGCLLLYMLYKRHISFYDILLVVGTAILTLLPYYFYIFCTNTMHEYFIFNWVFNMYHSERFHPYFSLHTLLSDQLLFFGYVIGLLWYLNTNFVQYSAYFSLGLLAIATFVVKFSFLQYYASALPFVALISAYAWHHLLPQDNKKIILMLFLTLQPLLGYTHALIKQHIKKFKHSQHKKIEYVLNNTSPHDYVYDVRNLFNLFRHDIDFLWFQIRMDHAQSHISDLYSSLTGKQYSIYEQIKQKNPRFISTYYLDIDNPIIKNYYAPTEFNDILMRNEEQP